MKRNNDVSLVQNVTLVN